MFSRCVLGAELWNTLPQCHSWKVMAAVTSSSSNDATYDAVHMVFASERLRSG